jgi:hypothetical protein
MHRGGADHQEGSMTTNLEGVCHDRFPHLRGDFTTCTKPCQRPYGHRPATPHGCADGHEWSVDIDRFKTMPHKLGNHMGEETGS